MSCETCKNKTTTPESIPYAAYELSMARAERIAKRLWITILTLIFLLVGSNCVWIWYNSQFEDVITTTYEADAKEGGNAVINGDGSVNINGESESNND